MGYDDAVASLFQVPVDQFVAERKRLAAELKAAGDKDGAAKLAKLARPPISAWVVDQLWWKARPAFEALFETAERLRDGKHDAMAAHRAAIAALRAQAVKILAEAEHVANEATLRRVTQTLAALAAAGDWEPDLPGALSADRDPPGFEAIGVANLVPLPVMSEPADEPAKPAAKTHATRSHDGKAHDTKAHVAKAHDDDLARKRRELAEAERRREREAAAERAEVAAAQRRAEAERAKAAAERHRIEAALRTARGDVAQREREVVKLERELATAHDMVLQAKAVVSDLEDRLAQLSN